MKSRKEFDNILDKCLERLLSGEAIEQCLQSYPEQAAELQTLLRTAVVVKKTSAIQPSAEFRARAGYQFRFALQDMESRKAPRPFSLHSRWATAVVTAIIFIFFGGFGTVVAASDSMPDGSLYQVKLTTEQIRLTLTPSAPGKAEFEAKLADNRVTEIVYMAGKGDAVEVDKVTRQLDTHLQSLASLAVPHGEQGGAMLAQAPEILPAPEKASDDLRVTAPPAPTVETDEDNHYEVAGSEPDELCELRLIVGHDAVDNPSRLRAALETVPQSVKPALYRAIAISVTGYENALKTIEEIGG